ncbi:MAG: carboxypeptidase-like regulatory domain-containing protein [Myxococcota bacterium]
MRPLLLLPLSLWGCETAPETIEGKVVDIWGNPIEGATVMVVGGTERPLTDADGRYRIPRAVGPIQVKAGRKGFIQDHREFEVKEGEPATGPLFELFPKPDDAGFYVVATGRYVKLEPRPVKSVGNALQQFRGVDAIGEAVVETEKPRVVFHTDLRQDEIMRLGLELHRLEFVQEASIPGPVGSATVAVKLFVDKIDVPVEFEPLRSKTDYLLTPKEPLEPGVYALQTQELLSADASKEAFEAIPPELRVVFPFEVR